MTTHAYRGYLIRAGLTGNWWVEKDGILIGHCQNREHGQRIIDGLYSIAAQMDEQVDDQTNR